MPELDSIRGVAILAVVFYHGFYWNIDFAAFPPWQRLLLTATWPGRLGVNLFFVLSGFLISGLLVDARNRLDYYSRFYARRARRILPVYLALLAVLFVARFPPKFLLLSLAYLSNLTPLFGIAISYPVLWSLAVEEHFYFVWPAVVRNLSSNALLWLSAGIITVSPVLRFVSFYHSRGFELNDYTWNSADGLASGAALAILLRQWGSDRAKVFRFVAVCGVIAVFLSPFAVSSRQSAIGAAMQTVPWHFAFTGALASCLLIGTSTSKLWVQIPWLRFFGYISYGLYLIHMLAFWAFDHFFKWHGLFGLVLRFIVGGGTATFLAFLSRRYFEDEFLRRPT